MIELDAERRVVEAERILIPADKLVISGVKSGHYLYLIESGEFRIQYQGGLAHARAGELCWLGSGMDRTIHATGPAAWIVIRIRNRIFAPGNTADQLAWRTLMRMRELGRLSPRVALEKPTLRELTALAGRMVDWFERGGDLSVTMLKSLLLQLLVLLEMDKNLPQSLAPPQPPDHRLDLMQAVLLLIERDLAAIPDVETLAARAGISRSGLYRLFKESGFPAPAVILEKARLEAAARLLTETGLTVLSIAMETGFGSLSTFYRAFKSGYGQSPAIWRRRLARPAPPGP
jgi:AraC-like DNA-binding protein